MSLAAAVVEWENLRQKCDAGLDVAIEAKRGRQAAQVAETAAREKAEGALTVSDAGDLYYAGHIKHHWAEKGQIEIHRIFRDDAADLANKPAEG